MPRGRSHWCSSAPISTPSGMNKRACLSDFHFFKKTARRARAAATAPLFVAAAPVEEDAVDDDDDDDDALLPARGLVALFLAMEIAAPMSTT